MTDKSINPKKQTVTGVFGPSFMGFGLHICDSESTMRRDLPSNANNGYDSGINLTDSTETRYC